MMKNLSILPHPQAPLFASHTEALANLEAAISEVSSSNLTTVNESIRQIIRQAGFVNLWFFLKYIAGFAGPYDEINDELQLDMANFRQAPQCMAPGARWGMFIPRGGNKSTVGTHGANSWEVLRDPNISILIINAVEEKAHDFMLNTLRTFRNNDLVAWLYPEYVIKKSQASMIAPNRTKFYTEDTVAYKGYSGELAGSHVNLLVFDDPIGIEDLDTQMMASISMDRAKKKYHTAIRALLRKMKIDRVGHIGTMYAIGDLHHVVVDRCKEVYGYKTGYIEPKPGGIWDIYYRKAIEDGKSIDESHYTVEDMEELRVADSWSYNSQYQNDPKEGSIMELSNYPIQQAFMNKHEDGWHITYRYKDKTIDTHLSSLNIAIGVDFAATSTGITAKTSRTAIEMWGMDGYSNKFLLRECVGYYQPRETIEKLFKLHTDFEGLIQQTILESNALQKFFIPIIREMALEKNIYFPATPKAESQPKEVRIRAGVGAALQGGNVYVVQGEGKDFQDERDLFPMDAYKRDALDAASKAIIVLHKPWSDEEETELKEEEDEYHDRPRSKSGY